MYICLCIYIYIYAYIYVCMFILYTYCPNILSIRIYIYMYICVYVYIYMYLCIYIYIYNMKMYSQLCFRNIYTDIWRWRLFMFPVLRFWHSRLRARRAVQSQPIARWSRDLLHAKGEGRLPGSLVTWGSWIRTSQSKVAENLQDWVFGAGGLQIECVCFQTGRNAKEIVPFHISKWVCHADIYFISRKEQMLQNDNVGFLKW